MMFTRSLFQTPDMIRQHEILTEMAKLVDSGKVKTTVNECMGLINAANLKKAHALLESGKQGKNCVKWVLGLYQLLFSCGIPAMLDFL